MAIKKSKKFIPENNISIKGNVELSSDKSLSIRAVLFSSIAYGVSKIIINNPGEDAETSLKAIQKLGIKVTKDKNTYTIFGQGLGYPETKKKITIDCGNSGTTTRLLAPLVAGSKLKAKFIGDQSLSSRPYRLEFLKNFLMDIQPTRNVPHVLSNISFDFPTPQKITKPLFLLIAFIAFEKEALIDFCNLFNAIISSLIMPLPKLINCLSVFIF